MSEGQCFCPCTLNDHAPSVCRGTADTSLPRKPNYAGNLELPVCRPCADRVVKPHQYPLVAPLGSGHEPDMPRRTAAELRSAVSNHPVPPLPPGRS